MPDLFNVLMDCIPQNGGAGKPAPEKEPELAPGQEPHAPPSACKRFTGGPLENGFPPPASEEFCTSLETFGDVLNTVYDNLTEWLLTLNPAKAVTDRLKLPDFGLTAAPPIGVIVRLWNSLVDGIGSWGVWLFDLMNGVFLYVRDLHECLTARCNSKASLAITLLRAVVRGLEKIRAGADPGVWITADIAVEFKLVNNWLDHAEAYFCPLNIPEVEEATRAYILNRITEKHRDCIYRLHGYDPATYSTFANVEREQLDWREAIQWVRRTGGGDEDERSALRNRGFITDFDVSMARELYWELPTIADHLHWLQRQVFDKEYVERYQLMEGFDGKFWPAFGHDLTSLGMRKEYAANHYAAHWVMPSPEQMREFVYRSKEIAAATGRPFTTDDYERILAEQDYNIQARGWFKSTIYQVPAISYLKDMYRQGIISLDELTEYHHRLGFSPLDADRFANIDDIQKRRMRAAQTHGWTTSAANSANVNGKIDDRDHERIFAELGYTSEEASNARRVAAISLENRIVTRARTRVLSALVTSMAQAIDVGIVSPDQASTLLANAGWPKEMASSFAAAQQATGGTKRIKQAVGYVRQRFLDGSILPDIARIELTRLGIQPGAINGYLSIWGLQQTPRRKRRTAREIVEDVATRHISTGEATVRLRNLGYDDADTRLYLADAQGKLQKINEGRLKAQQKAGAARQKQMTALMKETDKTRKGILKQMMKDAPVAKLQAWAKSGLVGKDLFMYRMRLYGYTDESAKLHYEQACSAKGAACVDTTPKQEGALRAGEGSGLAQSGSGNSPPPV